MIRSLEKAKGLAEELPEQGSPKVKKLSKVLRVGGDLAGNIDLSSNRISEVVGGLKRFVSLDESGRQVIDIRERIRSTMMVLAPQIGDLSVVLNLPEVPAMVLCFPASLNQALLSLIQNALNAIADDGEVRVTLELLSEAQLSVVVADDGPGIEPQRLESIFELGFTEKRGRVGLKLGLPTSKKAIEEIGGSLQLHSVVGEGTEARLLLPCAAQEA